MYYVLQAEEPNVARGEKIEKNVETKFRFLLAINPPPPRSLLRVSTTNFSLFGPAVWPAIHNKFIYECLVLLDRCVS